MGARKVPAPTTTSTSISIPRSEFSTRATHGSSEVPHPPSSHTYSSVPPLPSPSQPPRSFQPSPLSASPSPHQASALQASSPHRSDPSPPQSALPRVSSQTEPASFVGRPCRHSPSHSSPTPSPSPLANFPLSTSSLNHPKASSNGASGQCADRVVVVASQTMCFVRTLLHRLWIWTGARYLPWMRPP